MNLICKIITLGFALASSLVCDPVPANAAIVVSTCGTLPASLPAGSTGRDVYIDVNGTLCTAAASVSVGTFAPGGNYATLTATNASADVALPAGATVLVQNTGTTAVSCVLAVGAGTATASKNIIQPASTVAMAVGSNTHIACIDQTGSVSNVVAISGGGGLPAGWGGGSAGGGGGLSVTDEAAFTGGSSSFTPGGGFFQTTATSNALTNGQQGMWQMTANRAGFVNLRDAAGVERGSSSSANPVYMDALTGGSLLAAINAGAGTVGAAPPASGIYVTPLGSGATGGLTRALINCDQVAKYDASTSGNTKIITGVASRKVYFCGYLFATGGTATNLKLTEGTGTNCGTGTADLPNLPTFQLAANDRVGANSAFWNGLISNTNGDDVCFNASAGNAAQGWFSYAIL